MSNNRYADFMEEDMDDLNTWLYDRILLMALVKELQTLNETVKLLTMEVKSINLGLPIA